MKTLNFFNRLKDVFTKTNQNENFPTDRFIDAIAPVENELPQNDNKIIDELQSYLNQDFKTKGFEDGYKYHSKITRDLSIESIKAKFALLIEKKIEQRKSEKLQLEYDTIEMDGLSTDLTEKLKLKIERLIELIIDLEEQKSLSKTNSGWLSTSIAEYELGFEQGIFSYTETNEFLKLNSNL